MAFDLTFPELQQMMLTPECCGDFDLLAIFAFDQHVPNLRVSPSRFCQSTPLTSDVKNRVSLSFRQDSPGGESTK